MICFNKLYYDDVEGKLYWKSNDREAGWNDRGYRRISYEGISYMAHRIIYYIETGVWPPYIEHYDGNGLNNKIENLSEGSHETNMKNLKLYSSNTSGVSGVTWNQGKQRWIVRIGIGKGERKELGSFKDIHSAIECRKAAEITYDYHKNHGRLLESDIEEMF